MEKCTKAELEAPKWLNKSFLEEVLKKSEKSSNVTITNFNITAATEKGNHFASIMLRIAVDCLVSNKPKHISLILKTMPECNNPKVNLISDTKAFETEIKMYSQIIPKFHKILKEIGDDTILAARMIYSSLDPIKIIIFEDLTEKGYQMIPNKFLEPDEIDPLFEKICRWHAISFKLIKENDESIRGFQNAVFNTGKQIENWLNNEIDDFLQLLTDQNIDSIYFKKFEKLKETLIEKCKCIYQLKGNLCVLNHGDFHMNNLMVKIDPNNIIKELIMVDFQFCVAAPLTIDLSYLLSAVVNLSNGRDKRDEILYKYHRLFTNILQKLGYKGDIPTLVDIHNELMLHKELEIMMMIVFLPFMCAIKEKIRVEKKLIEEPEINLSAFVLPGFINAAKKFLPDLLYKGYLD